MGVSASKHTSDPSFFATSFVPASTSIISDGETSKWKSYDYVIVGGGTAGCVLAARLSEDPNVTVLLLEAGEREVVESHSNDLQPNAEVIVRLGLSHGLSSPFTVVVLNGREESFWVELGNSINCMIYQHCDPEDFDSWEKLGAPGWGYNIMNKYFEKMREDGPRIATNLPLAPISTVFVKAGETLGIRSREDFNDSTGTVGSGVFAGAVDEKHERSSAATAYLNSEVLKRPNLTVAVSVRTERILFTAENGGGLRAAAVQISSTRDGPKFAVGAAKEIIVCSGVIGSPQLLLLSGVGPATQLTRLGIPVVHDLPSVGRGMLDHYSPGSLVLRAKAGWTWDHLTQRPLSSAVALLKWLMSGTGPMSALPCQVAIFTRLDDPTLPYGSALPIKDRTSGPTAADLEFLIFPMAVINYGTGFPARGNYGVSVGTVLLKPSSTGTIELRTNNAYDPPLIDPNYFGDRSDMNAMIHATRFLLHLARTPPLSEALDLRNLETAPEDPDYYWIGDADPNKVSDDEIEAWIRKWAQSSGRSTSSMRMGSSPETSVVDAQLRMHGIQGLRVCDASVFPDHVTGHPCVPIIAVAERAAELIKGAA